MKLYKKELGNLGENIACEYIEKRGYKIIERNFRCYNGEIDIIAKDKDELVFIEVKTRTGDKYGQPIEAVDINKTKHIYRSAEYYVYKNNIKDIPIRLDIIEILIIKNKIKIRYIKKAIENRPFT